MEIFKSIIQKILKYRQYIIRESVKIAVVLMEGAAVYLILKLVYDVEEYARIFAVIFSLIAYLVSWMNSRGVKKVFAISYTVFAIIASGLNVSRDFEKSKIESTKFYQNEYTWLSSKLTKKTDLDCGNPVYWDKVTCAKSQLVLDEKWKSDNKKILEEIDSLPKPQNNVLNLEPKTYFRWMLIFLVAISPGFLFLHVSTEEAKIIEQPVTIPEKLPESFNQFSELLEKHFGYKKTTLRDWLRRQGWVQPADIEKLINEATAKHISTIQLLQEHIAERQS